MREGKVKSRVVVEFEVDEGEIEGGERISRVVKEFEGGEGKNRGL